MTATAVFMMLMAGVLGGHLFGLKMFEITKAKLNASEQARRVLNRLQADLTYASSSRIGAGSLGSFTAVANGNPALGNALQIYPGTNLSAYVRYYRDATDQLFKRMTNGMAKAEVLAGPIREQNVFSYQDFRGTNQIMGSVPNNSVVSVSMTIMQTLTGRTNVSAGELVDYYLFETSVAPRRRE
ncbi:MAG: hypothetical protein H7X97_00345 [Opitutaceae bacterium]|nr:hypothetical protein [Verrucomicrobiales bacterium]